MQKTHLVVNKKMISNDEAPKDELEENLQDVQSALSSLKTLALDMGQEIEKDLDKIKDGATNTDVMTHTENLSLVHQNLVKTLANPPQPIPINI